MYKEELTLYDQLTVLRLLGPVVYEPEALEDYSLAMYTENYK